jgi:uncharacterized phiE125 gp8 family phage protein
MRYALRRIVPPNVEPITVDEAKAHLRVEHAEDDDLIGSLIGAAREWAEGFTGRKLITQTWSVWLPAWPPARFRVPLSPVQSVMSIVYTPVGGTATTVSVDTYALAPDETLWLARGSAWPSGEILLPEGVTITVKVGYGDAATSVPKRFTQAMLLMIGHWYGHRESVNIGNITSEIPLGAEMLLWQERIVPV